MRKLIAFDDETFDKLRQLARDRMATFQELADEAFADLLEAWRPDRPQGCAEKERRARERRSQGGPIVEAERNDEPI